MNDAALEQIREVLKTKDIQESHLDRFKRLYELIEMQAYGLSILDLLNATVKHPRLLSQLPETLNGNAENSARLLGVTKQAFVAAALKQPQLLKQRPETLDGNAARSASLLGITKQAFVAAALKYPSLLYQRSQTLSDNVGKSTRLLGITQQAFVAAALKQPQLFYQKPETLDGNAEISARLLAISKRAFVAAALKQPPLFCQKPETLSGKAERSASLLGITHHAFVVTALKQPSLFYLKPQTLVLKKSYILKIKEALNDTSSIALFIVNAPVALTCGTSRLHACYILAKLGLKSGRLSSLVGLPARKAERILLRHYRDRIACSGRGARPLQIMHALNMITSLPAGIAPITRPDRIRNSLGLASVCSQAKQG